MAPQIRSAAIVVQILYGRRMNHEKVSNYGQASRWKTVAGTNTRSGNAATSATADTGIARSYRKVAADHEAAVNDLP
jgi:hypothetical protein